MTTLRPPVAVGWGQDSATSGAHGSAVGGGRALSPVVRAGELRPSQLLHTFGVGSVIDLPQLSAIVMGLDDWDTTYATPVTEDRLLAAVRAAIGAQVTGLRAPPYVPETSNPFDDWTRVGIPIAAFPRWLRCPACRYLGPIDTNLFPLKPDPWRPDRVRYVHTCKTSKLPTALPARFLLACRNGHLDDFPWYEFAHRQHVCPTPQLELNEIGPSGEAINVEVRCRSCPARRRMGEAFGESASAVLPPCRGRHPHLGVFDAGCAQPVRTILLGATNSWFAVTMKVLSIPRSSAALAQKVDELWAELQHVSSADILHFALTQPSFGPLRRFPEADVWEAIEARRGGTDADTDDPLDLKLPEWRAFSAPDEATASDDFRLAVSPVPASAVGHVEQVVLAERLREVGALVGFTRIDAPGERDASGKAHVARLARTSPVWVPCAEVRGEGIFLRFPEAALKAWEAIADGHPQVRQLETAHRSFRSARGQVPDANWPGPRYVMLHTFAHVLLRELALECGYSAAGLSERLYADADIPSAGILLFTSAPDSEGTLGGLVQLGRPDLLGPLIERALESARLCSSDPLCADHDPTLDASLHGAACHACCFAAETSCETGNRYLDRSLLVDTFSVCGLGFFDR